MNKLTELMAEVMAASWNDTQSTHFAESLSALIRIGMSADMIRELMMATYDIYIYKENSAKIDEALIAKIKEAAKK